MQSENFDKKLKDSLSQRPPGNDKPEWEKMETLLDKHLPVEKKDRRRIFFILFSFLLLGGGAFLIWQNNTGSKNDVAETRSQKQNTETKENNKPAVGNTGKAAASSQLPNSTNDQPASSQKFIPISQTSRAIGNILPGKKTESDASVAKASKNKQTSNSIAKKTDPTNQTIDELVKNTEPERTLIENLTKTETKPTITEKKDLVKEPEVEKTKTENKVEEKKEETKKNKKTKQKKPSL